MPAYRTRSQIDWGAPVVIQMGMTGAQFTNNVAPDTLLVWENGIWKYPRLDGTPGFTAGAIIIPNSTATKRQGPVRLAAWQADFNAATAWEIHVAGNPSNTSGEPYPSGDAALYAEEDMLVANATGTFSLAFQYGREGTNSAAVILMPGQRFYLTTSGATNPTVRLFFEPY